MSQTLQRREISKIPTFCKKTAKRERLKSEVKLIENNVQSEALLKMWKFVI
jgi:hypothetical protein